ncbi:CBS domain-containing protein [Oryzifoliimicrobium ureilyticus]|uniref:CBS domain-containing protein n=1 Tax=Oryzifoliimicrobium ureilyticus TaxID=3113724 RepID=UPI0030765BED
MTNTVKAILDQKGRDVLTAAPDASVADVTKLLSDKRIGAVVITGVDNRISGIFTERDVLNAVARAGSSCLERPVAALMTTRVFTCSEKTTVNELMELMTRNRFRHVPVEIDGRLAGIVSIGDVVKARMAEVEMEAEHIKAYIAG